jgi:hypothetical protein
MMPTTAFPGFKLPKLDLDALFGLQKANLAAVQEAQSVVLEAAQAIVRAQHGYAQELLAGAKAALEAKQPRQPQAVLAEVQAAAEKAVVVGKQNVGLGVAAQRRVADLVAKRVQANLDELKALAA